MANSRAGNVIRVDTSAAFTSARNIVAIKYIGASSGTASIKKTASDGIPLWEESGSTNTFNEVPVRSSTGIYVTVTNSAVVYIYLK